MKIRFIYLFALMLITALLVSCKKNHYRVNTSSIKTDIEISRLEQDLFGTDPEEIEGKTDFLKSKYGDFLQLFSYVINTGEINDPSFGDFLAGFCTDRQNNDVYGLTMSIFPDLDDIEKELGEAFRHYLYYFPDKTIPSVFSCITGFNSSIITGDSILGIGLDRYLGAGCKFYKQLGIYNYLAAKMSPEYIVPDCMYGWAATEWDFGSLDYAEENVLSVMIHEGKLKYFQRSMLPETPDSVIFGFNPGQMNFCNNNESRMWMYLIENDMIFKTDQFTITKLTGEAPFTGYFTNESPGKAAVWLGFRIVESYMMKNQDESLAGLLRNVDVQGILEGARYNPQ
jgi:hypothetical protein